VGNIAHYPNREAIHFIATKLAPLLAITSPSIKIRVVGASPENVPAEWQHPQIEYLGFSDLQTVEELFKTCDAMISPIKNTFGLKFKMAEAVAYGTPMISSEEALQCLPFIKGALTFAFGDAQHAAAIVSHVIGNRDTLGRMSQEIILSSGTFIESQQNRWFEELSPLRS
jgi:glycosyltransferase involved in cell wall biosynthesis